MARTKKTEMGGLAAALRHLHRPNKRCNRLFARGRDWEGNWLYEIQAIVAHQPAHDGSREFYVKWTKFFHHRNTWEAKDFIRRNPGGLEAFDSYIADKGL